MRLILLAFSLALAACDGNGSPGVEQGSELGGETAGTAQGLDRSNAGQPAPNLELANAEGAQSTLAEASGEPLLVNLWATWCAPCVAELPTLEALGERAGAPRVVAVSQDMAPRGSVDAFLERNGLGDLEVWHDPEMTLSAGLDAQVLPTTVLYDAQGREVWRYVGDLDWTSEEALRLIAEGRPAGTS